MGDGSWVGLDVQARSVVAAVVDDATGEVVVDRAPVGVGGCGGGTTPDRSPTRCREGRAERIGRPAGRREGRRARQLQYEQPTRHA